MKAEYDFTKGERGKFFRQDAEMRRLGKGRQKPGGDVRSQSACPREVGIRCHECPSGRFDHHQGERFGGQHHTAAVGSLSQERRDCPPQCGAGSVDLGGRLSRVDLEREIEPSREGQLGEQVIEERDAGRDGRRAAARRDPGAAHSSSRTMSAPSARRRSSIRS